MFQPDAGGSQGYLSQERRRDRPWVAVVHLLDVAAVARMVLAVEPASSLHWVADAFGLPFEYCTN